MIAETFTKQSRESYSCPSVSRKHDGKPALVRPNVLHDREYLPLNTDYLSSSWFGGVKALSLAMCLIQRADGTKVVRPFRGLRKVSRGLDETTLLKVVIMRMLEDGYQGNGQDSRSEI